MAKKILIVNVNWVGDVIFSTPFIRTIRHAYPDSYIACLLHPRCREVLEGNPRVDEIIIYDEEGLHRSLWGKLKLIRELRGKGFDIAFLLHRSFTKALLTYLGGIKRRVGYATKNRGLLLTDVTEEPTEDVHKIDYFLNIAQTLGIATGDRSYEFFIGQEERLYVKGLLSAYGIRDTDFLIAMNPGGNWGPKRWPKEHFAQLADRLIRDRGAKVVITGAQKDMKLAQEIQSAMRESPIIACGKTTLGQLAALFERANLVIANDTGPMHIASAVGARVIAIFGPTSPGITGPRGRGHSIVVQKNEGCEVPCYDFTCTDFRCMKAVGVEDVVSAAYDLILDTRK